MTECVFCKIVTGEAPASFVYHDDLVAAFLDIHPANRGHTLLVPKAHAAGIADLDPETGGHLFQVAMRLSNAVRQTVDSDGINLHVADGNAAGQEVYHFHLHIIPRFQGDRFGLRLRPRLFSRPRRSDLDGVAERIRHSLQP